MRLERKVRELIIQAIKVSEVKKPKLCLRGIVPSDATTFLQFMRP